MHIGRSKHLIDSGLVVTTVGFSHPLHQDIPQKSTPIELICIEELKNRLFDPSHYLNNFPEARNAHVGKIIDANGYSKFDECEVNSIQEHLDDFLCKNGGNILCLVGGYGIGKTTQLINLAKRKTSIYAKGLDKMFPIFIPMDRYRRHNDGIHFDEFVTNYLSSMYAGSNYDWAGIRYRLENGDAFLVLDGLDEIPKVNNLRQHERELSHVLKKIPRNSKVIISVREILNVDVRKVVERVYATSPELAPHVSETRIKEFCDSQIKEYLKASGVTQHLLDSVKERKVLARPLILALLAAGEKYGYSPVGRSSVETIDRTIDFLLQYKDENILSEIPIADWKRFLGKVALKMSKIESKGISI